MKIIFLSMMFSDTESDIKLSKHPNTISGHKIQESLVRGLEENDCELYVMNIPRIRAYPDYPQVFIRTQSRVWGKRTAGVDIGFINLPILNYLTQAVTEYRLLRSIVRSDKNEQCILLTFNTNLHACFAMLLARLFNRNVLLCSMIGDLHGVFGLTNYTSGLKGRIIRWLESFQDYLSKKYDLFVFVTRYMAGALEVEDKPYQVVECLLSIDEENLCPICSEEKGEKIIFYAGSLCKEYGIEHMLRAFSMIENPNYCLRIAGSGDCEELVMQYAKKDSRISFLGYISPNEVKQNQQDATLLINARTTEYEFVKYSFAGKTMECLVSGKPYIAHKLPCDPSEYADYIQYPKDDSDEALRDKIVEICELSAEERNEIGQRARKFILEKKNPKAMCKRIIDMWSGALNSGN